MVVAGGLGAVPENSAQSRWSFSRIESAVAVQLNGGLALVVGGYELLDPGDQLLLLRRSLWLDAGEAATLDRSRREDPVAEGPRSGSSASSD